MLGAMLGDVIGSRFEFDRGPRTTEFELFTQNCEFTDDTVMTIAVADGLIQAGYEATTEEIKKSVIRCMKTWGRRYPDAGYGTRFIGWIFDKNEVPKPYGSWGNGSAMRVSSAGWLYNSLKRTIEVAKATAEVSHNHPEGIKGAVCTAAVIYLARTGVSKQDIEAYVTKEYGYDLSESLEDMRKRHRHDESCMDSLPKALKSFFCGNSYEEVVRNAVSLGGDTDTIAAIAGAMAEACYGIPEEIAERGKTYLTEDMLSVLNRFGQIAKYRVNDPDYTYRNNRLIKTAIRVYYDKRTKENLLSLLDILINCLLDGSEAPIPMADEHSSFDSLDVENLHEKDVLHFDNMQLRMETLTDPSGSQWFPLYTDQEEIERGEISNIVANVTLENILRSGLVSNRVEGVVINPFGRKITLEKDILEIILNEYDQVIEQKGTITWKEQSK